MQKLIPKYGVAAHLAFLAVSPLFLFPYCGEGWIASVVICLSVLAAVWMVMEPSRRSGELLFEARERVVRSLVADPLFWVFVVILLLSGIRWANGGVGMGYDAELRKWSLRGPTCSFMPGTVEGCGAYPFAGTLGAFVLAMSFRHALGKAARMSFLFVSSFLAAIAAITACVMAHLGVSGAVQAASAQTVIGSFAGTAFALYFLGGLTALAGMFEIGWNKMLLLFSIAIGGTFAGAAIFLPPQLSALYMIAGIVAILVMLVYVGITHSAADSLKCAVAILIASLIPILLILALDPGVSAFEHFCAMVNADTLFAESFVRAREVFSRIAFKEWTIHPWLGSGVGSFPLGIRFNATESDWVLIDVAQKLPTSGWWALLAERGIVGALMVALPLGFMVYSFFRRLVGAFSGGSMFVPGCFLGVIAVATLAVQSFIDPSFLAPEAVMAVAAFIAMSAASFPLVKKTAMDDTPAGDKLKGDREDGR